ncbi:MAG: LamG-like jellyroll fold domain-containing protein [Candidatus Absconditabacteria bacterium]
MAKNFKKFLKFFTLIELIIVIAIIAVLGATAFLLLTQWMSKGRDATKISTIRTIKTALDINYTAKGEYPIPQDAVEHTGANGTKLYQGYVGANMVAELQRTPIDPTTKKPYIYSYMKLNGGQGYYQIGTSIENTVGYNGYELAKADLSTTAKVEGNYEFDPSLPSLIIVGGNETSKGIYDPSNCYVLDGGKNTVDGTECVAKNDMPLKDYDNGLVGYWPFEEEGFEVENHKHGGTNFFKDHSGNSHHAFNSGAIQGVGFVQPILSGGYIGSGAYFTSGSLILGSDMDFGLDRAFTISAITNIYVFKSTHPYMFSNRQFISAYVGCQYNYLIPNVACPEEVQKGLSIDSVGITIRTYNLSGTQIWDYHDQPYKLRYSNLIENNKYFLISYVINNNKIQEFVNGTKIYEVNHPGTGFKQTSYEHFVNSLITLGGSRASRNRDFHGIIDEVKIYNRALTESEILQQAKIAGF